MLKELFFGESSNDCAMEDAKWMLCVIGCNLLMFGLLRSFFGWQTIIVPFLAGAAFIAIGLIPLYILRVAAFAIFTVLLWVDFYLRHNPFSIAYSLIGVYHVYLLLRWKPIAEKKEEGPAS